MSSGSQKRLFEDVFFVPDSDDESQNENEIGNRPDAKPSKQIKLELEPDTPATPSSPSPSHPPTCSTPILSLSPPPLIPLLPLSPAPIANNPRPNYENCDVFIDSNFNNPIACVGTGKSRFFMDGISAVTGLEKLTPYLRLISGQFLSTLEITVPSVGMNEFEPPAIRPFVRLNYPEVFALAHYVKEILTHLEHGTGTNTFYLTKLSDQERANLDDYNYIPDVSTRVVADASDKMLSVVTYGEGYGQNQMHRWLVETGGVTLTQCQFLQLSSEIKQISDYLCLLSTAVDDVYAALRTRVIPILRRMFESHTGHEYTVCLLNKNRPFQKVIAYFMNYGYLEAVCKEIEGEEIGELLRQKLHGLDLLAVATLILNQTDLMYEIVFPDDNLTAILANQANRANQGNRRLRF
jgi:hypothetical protein